MKVWVIGGSSGIGEACVQLLLQQCHEVICLSRREPTINIPWIPLDLSWQGEKIDETIVEAMAHQGGLEEFTFEQIMKLPFRKRWFHLKRGCPDWVIVSSGMGAQMSVGSWKSKSWIGCDNEKHAGMDELFDVNLKGVMWAVNSICWRAMRRKRNIGKIFIIGSTMADHGARGQEIYAAAKAGLRGYVKSACRILARKGVLLGLIEPGWTYTPMTNNLPNWQNKSVIKSIPAKRMATAGEMAQMIVGTISTYTSFAAGTIIQLGGGI